MITQAIVKLSEKMPSVFDDSSNPGASGLMAELGRLL